MQTLFIRQTGTSFPNLLTKLRREIILFHPALGIGRELYFLVVMTIGRKIF
jgi:hypothetical protein